MKSFATGIGALLGTLAFIGVTWPLIANSLRNHGVNLANWAPAVSAIAALILAFLAIIAFAWGLEDWRAGFLHISLDIDTKPDFILIKTTVENKGLSRISRQEIAQAFLLIQPERENPIDGYNLVAEAQKPQLKQIEHTDEINCCSEPTTRENNRPMFDHKKQRAIVRLPFYYRDL